MTFGSVSRWTERPADPRGLREAHGLAPGLRLPAPV